ncbi:MAG: PdaC/SigV domain-containing protein [Treponema sp.]
MLKIYQAKWKCIIAGCMLLLAGIPVYAAGSKETAGTEEAGVPADTAPQNTGMSCRSSVNYPFFSAEPALNMHLAKLTGDVLKQFNENFYAGIAAETTMPFTHECTISARNVYENDNTISLLLSVYSYTGGAHGETTLIPVNYSKNTKALLSLKDVIGSVSEDTLMNLSQEARRLLQEQQAQGVFHASAEWIHDGTEPKEENFAVFCLEQDRIRIVFRQYQVAAYSEGMPEIVVPLSFFKR